LPTEGVTVADDGHLSVSGDYFASGRDGYADPLKAPEITRTLGVPDLPHRSFVWSIASVVSAVLAAGQWFAIVTPGAGGFGLPARRDPDAVARDLAQGVISRDTAREAYGRQG
jgi:N-methylhydantoinase B/oxoprolinase/acetone carboxylase alpha subunit